jgi:hypothetical protein
MLVCLSFHSDKRFCWFSDPFLMNLRDQRLGYLLQTVLEFMTYKSTRIATGLVHYGCIRFYEGVTKSFRTGRLERKLQMVQLSATRYSYIAILWVSQVSFAAITLCVASQRVFIVVSVYFVIDSVRKLLDTPSYISAVLTREIFFVLVLHLKGTVDSCETMMAITIWTLNFVRKNILCV